MTPSDNIFRLFAISVEPVEVIVEPEIAGSLDDDWLRKPEGVVVHPTVQRHITDAAEADANAVLERLLGRSSAAARSRDQARALHSAHRSVGEHHRAEWPGARAAASAGARP